MDAATLASRLDYVCALLRRLPTDQPARLVGNEDDGIMLLVDTADAVQALRAMTPDTRQHLVDLAMVAVCERLADDPDVAVLLAELDRLSAMVDVLTPTARAELEHQAGLPVEKRGWATMDVWTPRR